MTARQKYVDKVKTKIDKWNQDIDAFEKKAQAASDDMKEEYQSQLKTLKKKRDEAEKQIETLQAATDSAWNDLKQGGEEAWHAISHALTSVKTRIFHKETTK